jgi:hypothetical protein
MELDSHEPRVVAYLDDLHTLTLNILADKGKPGLLEPIDHSRVDFVPMPVSL